MTVYDLDIAQLFELKDALYYGCPETNFEGIDKEYDDISMDDIVRYFGHYTFCEEDFA